MLCKHRFTLVMQNCESNQSFISNQSFMSISTVSWVCVNTTICWYMQPKKRCLILWKISCCAVYSFLLPLHCSHNKLPRTAVKHFFRFSFTHQPLCAPSNYVQHEIFISEVMFWLSFIVLIHREINSSCDTCAEHQSVTREHFFPKNVLHMTDLH